MLKANDKGDTFASIMFASVFLDSLFSYFTSPYGFTQVAIFPLVLFLVYLLINGVYRTFPPVQVNLILFFVTSGFIMGIANASSIGLGRIPQIISFLIAFIIGYRFFANLNDDEDLWMFFASLSSAYIITCIIALLEIYPQLFPMITKLWSDGSKLYSRPEIMTDQNFQIFYLFPTILTIFFAKNSIRIITSIILIFLAAYVLIRLQTRSGTIYLVVGVALSLLLIFRTKAIPVRRLVFIFALCAIIGPVLLAPKLMEFAEEIIIRFANDENPTSAGGRLYSFLFLFNVVWNPIYWLPSGPEAFIGVGRKGIPLAHSNFTAVFLEAGIIGLTSWFVICVYPLVIFAKTFWKNRMDAISSAGFAACILIFLIQLSLSATVTDQLWLWFGAAWGCVHRYKRSCIDIAIRRN